MLVTAPMDRTYVRRTTLATSLNRAELAINRNDSSTLRHVGAALGSLYSALHGLSATVSTDVCVETAERRVRVTTTAAGGGPVYTRSGSSRIAAALVLLDDLALAIRQGDAFAASLEEK